MPNTSFLTKYQAPRLRRDHVTRGRLVSRLSTHSSARLQLVVAPPAYGKTCLLSELATDPELTVCWFSVSEEDADPLAFARGVYSSVKSQFPTLESVHFLSGSDNDGVPPGELAAGVVNSIFRLGDRRMMLVWDDFHKASENQSVCQLVDLIIEHLPQSCSLVIASRTMPELGILDRLLAYREALVLRADDLALTASEVHSLLVFLRGEDVSMENAQNILDKTGGWVGGVLASEAGSPERHMSIPADDHALRVFATSALAQEPPELQHQLMATSVLPYMDTDLCNALLDSDDSERMLDRAYARIGFMSRMGDKSHAYKWHDLIREGLEAQFRSEYPAEYRKAALRAGNAFQARGEYEHAIELYLKADEHNSAAKLLTQEGSRLIAEGRWNHLDSVLTRIPGVELDEQPALLNLRGRVSARLGDKEAAISFFNKALAHLEETEEPVEAARTLVSRSSTYSLLGFDREAEEDAWAAVETLQKHKGVESDLSRAYRQLGWINLRRGHLEDAEQWLTMSSMALRRDADVRDTAMVSAALGWVCTELGKMAEAHTYLDKAVQAWRKVGNLGSLAVSLNNLGLMWHRQGLLDDAEEVLREALDNARATDYTRIQAIVLTSLGDVTKDRNQLDQALEKYSQALELAQQSSEANLISYLTGAMGDVHRLKGDYETAAVLLDQSLVLAESQNQLHEQSLGLMYKAALEARRGDYDSARQELEIAATLVNHTSNKHDQALLELYSALVAFLSRDFQTCKTHLENLAHWCESLGYSGFLMPEAHRAPAMFEWASRTDIGGGLYQRIESVGWDGNGRSPLHSSLVPGRLSLRIEAYVFGKSRVVIGDECIAQDAWGSPKARELLFYLLASSSPQRKDAIIADLWPDLPIDSANNNFHSSLRRLRVATHPVIVVFKDGAYEVNPDIDTWFDLVEFQELLDQAEQLPRGSEERAQRLEDALNLYTGPVLEEFYSEWTETLRRDTEAKYLRALGILSGFYSAKRRFSQAIGVLEQAAKIDALEEQIRLELMQCFMREGDAKAAIHTYMEYSHILADEMGEQPSPEMRKAYEEAVAKH